MFLIWKGSHLFFLWIQYYVAKDFFWLLLWEILIQVSFSAPFMPFNFGTWKILILFSNIVGMGAGIWPLVEDWSCVLLFVYLSWTELFFGAKVELNSPLYVPWQLWAVKVRLWSLTETKYVVNGYSWVGCMGGVGCFVKSVCLCMCETATVCHLFMLFLMFYVYSNTLHLDLV